jgi:hypothetical protein
MASYRANVKRIVSGRSNGEAHRARQAVVRQNLSDGYRRDNLGQALMRALHI